MYAYLRLEPKHIDEILLSVDFSLPELMKILFSLEAKGIVYSPAALHVAIHAPCRISSLHPSLNRSSALPGTANTSFPYALQK